MTIKTTRWTSDVCGCIIEYTWDDAAPQGQETLQVSKVIEACPAHSSPQLPTENARFNAAIEENQRKNKAHAAILEVSPTGMYDVDQSGQRQLKSGITLSWELTGEPPDRVMTLSYSGITLTPTQKTNIQKQLDSRFGEGKVKLA